MRIAYFDQIRALAIILVVWIHSWDTFILSSDYVATSTGWIVYQIAHLLGRYGVPLFVMLTGALVLDREYPNLNIVLYKKVPRFIGGLIFASIFYAIFVHVLFGQSYDTALRMFLTGNPIGAYHLWYMYMLVGLYLSLPFAARLLTTLSECEVRYLILLTVILVVVPWTLGAANIGFSYYESSSFIVQTYLLYAIVGYWLHKYEGFKSLSLIFRLCLLIVTIIGTVILKFEKDFKSGEPIPPDGITWYNSLFVMVASCIIFTVIRDINSRRLNSSSLVKLLSLTAFSIYIWHLVAIYLVVYVRQMVGGNAFFMVLLSLIAGLFCGICIYGIFYRSKINWLVK